MARSSFPNGTPCPSTFRYWASGWQRKTGRQMAPTHRSGSKGADGGNPDPCVECGCLRSDVGQPHARRCHPFLQCDLPDRQIHRKACVFASGRIRAKALPPMAGYLSDAGPRRRLPGHGSLCRERDRVEPGHGIKARSCRLSGSARWHSATPDPE